MNKFQELIIKQNQKERNEQLQKLILFGQFCYSCICLLIAIQILERLNNTQSLKFEFIYYISLPTAIIYLEISEIIFQTITIIFSLMTIIIIIFEENVKSLRKIVLIIWDLYPNIIQIMIIHNSGYCLLLEKSNFLLSIFNIFLAVLISQFMSLYSFQQNETQILLKPFFERSFITFFYSVLSFFAGLMLDNIYALYIFLASILLFDLYFGVFYYIKPHMQFLSLDINKLAVQFSFSRVSVAGFLFYFSGFSIIISGIFTVPLMMKINRSLWDQRYIQFIYKTNMYFQYICIDKFRPNHKMIESYIEYFKAVINYKKPFNRVFMLSLFCNHMNKCQNLKCFCQNKSFYENIKVTSQLSIDIKEIQQQINYAVGEIDIQQCYQQLLLIFFDNYISNTKYTSIGETLILKQSLFELKYFTKRLFQTKLRLSYLKINYPFFHPIKIQRIATSKLITENLQMFIGLNSNVQFEIESTLNYFKLIDNITIQLKSVIEEKISILQFIKRNYQNPLPYQLNYITQQYFVKLNNLEVLINQACLINGLSFIVRELQDEFYNEVKIDYEEKNKHLRTQIPFINNNLTAFIMCDYEGELLIKQYSNNLLEMINTSSQIKGSPIETIVPNILSSYHRVAVAQMVQTGSTKLVNKNQYSLKVKSNKYVLEVDALLRYDYRNLNQLRFIGFIQLYDKDSMLILADEKGKIDSASRSASALLKLDDIDITQLNYFQLSPNLLLEKDIFDFDGFILIPKHNHQKCDTLSLYRFFISRTEDCEIFLVNAKSEKVKYSKVTIISLKINSFYHLKEPDFKIIALDLMIRQFMIQKKVGKSQYILSHDSVRRIEVFRKTLKIKKINSNDSDDYNLENHDDSERQIQFLDQNKSYLPEFIPSLDSIRTQQEKLLVTMEQCKDVYQSIKLKDKSFDNYKKFDSAEMCKQDQDSLKSQNQNTHQIIEIELNGQEDQNIEEQLQVILSNVKKRTTRKEQLEMKNQIKNKIKASTWQGSGKQQESKKLIKNIVGQFLKSRLNYILQLKLISVLIVSANIGFILGFTINCIINLAGIQMDSNNQTYPLILFQDINLVMLGIQLQDQSPTYFDLSMQFVQTGADQYQNLSIYVNDQEHDYHTFLQDLDEDVINVKEKGIELIYKKKYFFKNYMVEKFRTIEESSTIDVFGQDSQFLFDNFPSFANELWNLKNLTTRDVKERITQLTEMSQTLLIFSIVINSLLISLFILTLTLIIKWRNKLYSTFFLFSNLSSTISQLNESIRVQNDFDNNKYKKIDDEIKNKKSRIFEQLYGLTVLFVLLLISLGFYIPLFLYVNSVNNQSIDVNQLQTELSMMQLKLSINLNWYAINQTEQKYQQTFIHNASQILQSLVDQCTASENFVLYKLPYDSDYDYFPEIQQYSQIPLCNCSLIDFQLQNGFQGFHSYVSQHLQDYSKYFEIMQAYKIVFDYQIAKKIEFDNYMQSRLNTSQQTLEIILEIIVILILLTNIFIYILVLLRIEKLVQSTKYIIHLFPTQLIANNKYTLQQLIQSSTHD